MAKMGKLARQLGQSARGQSARARGVFVATCQTMRPIVAALLGICSATVLVDRPANFPYPTPQQQFYAGGISALIHFNMGKKVEVGM